MARRVLLRLPEDQAIDLEIAVLTGATCNINLGGALVRITNTFQQKPGMLATVTPLNGGGIPFAVREELGSRGYHVKYRDGNLSILDVYEPKPAPKTKNATYYFRHKPSNGSKPV